MIKKRPLYAFFHGSWFVVLSPFTTKLKNTPEQVDQKKSIKVIQWEKLWKCDSKI